MAPGSHAPFRLAVDLQCAAIVDKDEIIAALRFGDSRRECKADPSSSPQIHDDI
jgi:hypothetical protein